VPLQPGTSVLVEDNVREPATAPRTRLLDQLRTPLSDRALMVLMVLLAAALRLPNIDRAYWVDEGISVGIASHHLREIPSLLRLDGSPPLFYVILHFWVRAFGTSEVATHLLPLLTSLLLIPVAWWCARTLFGPTAARYATVLAATNPFLAWFSTETRMYPLICGLSMLGVTMAVRAARDHSTKDGLWAVLFLTALIYSHNWGLYVVATTTSVLLAVAWRKKDWILVLGVAAGAAIIAVAYLPWLPSLLFQTRNTAAPWAIRPAIGDLIADPSSTMAGTLAVVVVPLIGLGVVWTWWSNPSTERDAPVDLVGSIGLLTVAVGWLVAQLDPSWTSRYLAVALGPLLLALVGVLGPSRLGRQIMIGCSALLVIWSVIGSLLPTPNARYAKSNVAAVAHDARPFLRGGDLVVVTQTEQVAVLAHYLPAGLVYATPTGVVTDPHVVDWRDLIHRLATANACDTIAPAIDGLPIGGHVLVVNPLREIGASGTTWSRTVNAQVEGINDLLFNAPALQEIGSLTPATAPKPYSAVTGLLFVKGRGPALCS
jgi:mannosyltransferase